MKPNYEIALEVIDGLWGNGEERREKLEQYGYDYDAIQDIVNDILSGDGIESATLKIDVDLTKYKRILFNFI